MAPEVRRDTYAATDLLPPGLVKLPQPAASAGLAQGDRRESMGRWFPGVVGVLLCLLVQGGEERRRRLPKCPASPCSRAPYAREAPSVRNTSLIYIKIHKCASSTTGGVARRIAARNGLDGEASGVTTWDCNGKRAPGVSRGVE